MENVEVTTCDPMCGSRKEAHFSARKALTGGTHPFSSTMHLYIAEHKVGYLPIVAIPTPKQRRILDQREDSDVSSTFGYSRSEGWFAKFSYVYSMKYYEDIADPFIGKVNLDLTEKLGPGLKVRQDFLVPVLGVGSITAFYQREWEFNRSKIDENTLANARENYDLNYTQELNLAKSLQGSLKMHRRNDIVPALNVNGRDTRTNSWTTRWP
jgi:hypothetical protein